MEEDQDCPVGPPSLFKDQSVDEDTQVDIETESPTNDLENFRKEWEQELSQNQSKQMSSSFDRSNYGGNGSKENVGSTRNSPTDDEIEVEARQLFIHAVGLEKHGDLYEACRYYKRAFTLVPDIERRVSLEVYPHHHQQQQQGQDADKENICPDEEEEVCLDLRSKFLNRIEDNAWVWLQKEVEGLDRNKLHLSDFPEEVLKYIVRWVVSKDVDVRSLDSLSQVSIGFYVICRSELLWRDICSRIWGNELRQSPGFSSYREMYFTRSHVNFDGVYISKVTYVRSGENSFQDSSYRPWHLVEYYRYIRFLPNFTVLFLTTSEPPNVAVQQLRDPNPKSPTTKILHGRYSLSGQTITILCTTIKKPKIVMNYNMEFTIGKAKGNRYNWILKWINYAVTFNSSEQSQFEIEPNKFPPLVFSRVKSFTRMSEYVL